MNNLTQMKQRRNMFFILGVVVLAVVGVSVWYIQNYTTVFNPHAAASTTLAFTQPTQTVSSGQQVASDITIDPGTNSVSTVKLVVTYNSDQLQVASDASSLTVNTTAFPQILEAPATSCTGTLCTLVATYAIGADPTKAIKTKTTLATFNATVLATDQTAVTVGFDQSTAVYSVGSGDQAGENVLSSSTPLTFTVGGGTTGGTSVTPTEAGVCSVNTSTCAWDNLSTATSYHYKITDKTTGNIVSEGDLTPPQASVNFPQVPGNNYTCEVKATNACKTDASASVSNTCPAITGTPTMTPTLTLSPTATPTPLPSATPGPTATPEPSKLTCNGACTQDSNCQSGLACIGGFCRNPSCSSQYSCTCAQPTSVPAPTNPPAQQQPQQPPQYIAAAPTNTPIPTQAPKMLPTGPGDTFIKIGIIGAALALIGGLLIFGL